MDNGSEFAGYIQAVDWTASPNDLIGVAIETER